MRVCITKMKSARLMSSWRNGLNCVYALASTRNRPTQCVALKRAGNMAKPTTSLPQDQSVAPVVRVVQITDTHLFREPEGRLLGMNTQQSFEQVLGQIADIGSPPDLVLATGDISQDASVESYQRFAATVSRLAAPCYWIPGNHDRVEV